MINVESRVAELVGLGFAEDRARVAVVEAKRQENLARDVVVGGAFALADQMPDTDFVLRPIIVRGQLIGWTAHPGGGKSTVGAAIVVSFALRRSLGPLEPVGDGLVYYISAEDTQGTRNRLLAESVRHKLTPGERAVLDERLRWVHVNAQVRPELILAAVREDAEGRETALIVVDTGPATFVGSDENANTEMQDHAASWRSGADLPGNPAVLVMCHPAKGAGADNLTPRGGGAFAGSIDANLTLWRDEDIVTLAHTKLRSEHFEPIKFRLEPIPLVLASGAHVNVPVAVPVTDATATALEHEMGERREKILLALFDASDPSGVRDIARRVFGDERKKSTVARDIEDMARGSKALIERDALAGGFALTAAGRKLAAAIRQRGANAYREAVSGR